MSRYSQYNFVYRMQKWMDSVPGQTFMNYAYSWGASVVILGTLFKLTHLPGANVMLYLGMGTEVLVFFISAFDRPFDKTAIGMDLPTHLEDGNNGDNLDNVDNVDNLGNVGNLAGNLAGIPAGGTVIGGGSAVVGGGGTVIIGGGGVAGGSAETGGVAAEGGASGVVGGVSGIVGGVFGGGGNGVPATMDEETATGMQEATETYVEQLNNLNEILKKVSEQSERLSTNSVEMENLNRTLTGISRIYEMQLKGISQQVGTIDQINEQTNRMAEQIAELNRIYARMIEAMTNNGVIKQ